MNMMKKIIFGLLFILLLFPYRASAQTTEEIKSFNDEIIVNSDSTVNFKETIKYYFSAAKHGIFRFIPYRYLDQTNNKNFQTSITDISVTDENNQAYQFTESKNGNFIELKIGDPDATITGEHTYVISYKVSGVINYFSDHDELFWNVTGDKWTVPINNVSAKVTLPNRASSIKQACYSGPTGSTETNCAYTNDNGINYKADTGPLTIVLGWNKGVVTEISRTYEKSYRHESGWFWLVLALVFIYLMIMYFKNGKDPFGRGTIAPEFEAPDGLLPAEVGTIIDEKIDNKDISATIIDLAVRGYLKIKKLDSGYTLTKVKDADNKLKEYETTLLNALFSGGKEADLSSMHINDELRNVRKSIISDLMERKYFVRDPQKARNVYLIWGFVIILFGGVFFFLSWNLVFAIFFSGILFIIFSRFMPKKTKEGVIAKEKSLGLKEFLYRADRYKLKWEEKENIFEKFLPYAMVFGVADLWAKNFKNIYKNPPDWYDGNFTTFSAVIFANEMSNFSSTASSSYSPPAASGSSGFGGGYSGGGFGGGGGGSW